MIYDAGLVAYAALSSKKEAGMCSCYCSTSVELMQHCFLNWSVSLKTL